MFFFGMMFRSLHVTSICWFLVSTRGSVLRNNSEPDPRHVLGIVANYILGPASFVLNLCLYIFNGKIFGEDKSKRIKVALMNTWTDTISSPCLNSGSDMKQLRFFFRISAVYNYVWRSVILIAMGIAYRHGIAVAKPNMCSLALLQDNFDGFCFLLAGWGIICFLTTEATFACMSVKERYKVFKILANG